MNRFLHRLSFDSRYFPVFLLLITVLGFGLLIPWLGFYWDDWAKILVSRLWGPGAYFAYYASDRPASSLTHILFTPLVGEAPIGWHLLVLALRWLSTWAMFWTLNGIWPGARWQNAAASLLFLVYPVFLQQPTAVTFHQQWFQYALFLFSLGAMVAAFRRWHAPGAQGAREARAWTAASLAAMLAHFSITEYFVTLELLRPLVLWFLVGQCAEAGAKVWVRLGRVMRVWLPFGAVLAFYVGWRLFFYVPATGSDPHRAVTLYNLIADPTGTLRWLGWAVLTDGYHILAGSWADLLSADLPALTALQWGFIGLGVLAALLVTVVLLRMDVARENDASFDQHWLRQAAALGILALLLGPVPAWVTGRQVVFDFHSDRFAMPAMFGAGLLFAVGIEWLAQRRLQKALLVGALVGYCATLHLQTANTYRWIWTEQQRFFWQLSWRAPGLERGTALLIENEPFPNQGLFSTSSALNLLYPQPGVRSGERLGYWVYTLHPRYDDPPDRFNGSITTTFRTLHFDGKLNDSLLVYHDPRFSNCLWVLSKHDALNPYLPDLVRHFLPASDLSRIHAQGTSGYPPEDLFGAEPEHGWCWYFEKAELAVQQEDWAGAAVLGDEVLAAGYHPDDSRSNSPREWMPVIEGYARVGRAEDALRLAESALEVDPHYQEAMCALWSELGRLPVLAGCEKE